MCKLAAELVNIETTTSRIKEWCRLQRAEHTRFKTIAKKGHPISAFASFTLSW